MIVTDKQLLTPFNSYCTEGHSQSVG